MAYFDLIVKRGATFKKLFYFQDADHLPIDITGNTYVLTVKKYLYLDDTDAQVQRSATVVDGSGGIIQVEMTVEETAMPEGKYYYDVRETTPSDEVTVVLEGKLKAETTANAPEEIVP